MFSSNRKTKKFSKKKGGDIHNNDAFKHILSIGYELETSSLSKLTLISQTTDKGEPILLNTDTARKDLDIFMKKGHSSVGTIEEEEEDDDFILRQEETMDFPVYNSNYEKDENVSFLVTNDIVDSPFVKFLNSKCSGVQEELEITIDDFVPSDIKNELYHFVTDKGKKYKIQFEFHDKETPCSVFSDVEWIFTYYKPKQSENIIIDTFQNVLQNLLSHLRDLFPTPGSLYINTCVDSYLPVNIPVGVGVKVNTNTKDKIPLLEKGGDSIQKRSDRIQIPKCEHIANRPETRVLYHKPKTNMYYLQSHYYEKELTLRDICITPQMTFSAHISNIIPIMIALVKDTINSIPTTNSLLKLRFTQLRQIYVCVDLLLKKYNTEAEPEYQILLNKKPILYKSIYSYLFLIMYKLYLYYNSFLTSEKIKYFKDALFFNSRHSNHILYLALKQKMILYFYGNGWIESTPEKSKRMDETCIEIILKILVQKDILETHFVEKDNKHIRKNAFNPKNILDKNSSSYGNPAKSLISYFHFFEKPIDNDTNITEDDEIVYYDWLEYKRIDAFSQKMELKSDIILMEFRTFTRALSSYIYSVLDENSREKMTQGICNQMSKTYEADVRGISVSILSDFNDYLLSLESSSSSKRKRYSKKGKTMKRTVI